ncbi:MAG: SUMF1/EgtB/PvdO family nonheme iron enzyme [Prolixibacteraceae bacterium]|nr:SUMF1/EgtB/PvdO family nonheme iron enzyme [Prolixibacteraceae bacterium]
MKNNIPTYQIIIFFVILITGCKSDIIIHELKGEKRPVWFEPVPYGMVYLEPGHYQMGGGDALPGQQPLPTRNVSVNSFWIDETEITNSEYRQYVKWVVDSVAASQTFKAGLSYYMATDKDKVHYDPPVVDRVKIGEIWTDNRSDVRDAIDSLFYNAKNRFRSNEIDYRKIFYEYFYIDLKKAAQKENSYVYDYNANGELIPGSGHYESGLNRSDFIVHERVPVYPDTLCWVRDFTYSYNEPWTQMYFHHRAFDNYPVVGVTWEQANAFCHWRTVFRDAFLQKNKIMSIHPYRLPTEAEWEYAARGGKINNNYPWGSYYTLNKKGCYKANFKPKRGNYVADSYYTTKTMKVGSFDPNDYGLFDMAGNVAEWTSTAYNELSYSMYHDYNPEFQYDAAPDDQPALKRKVVRGGSWKDVAYYLQVSARDYEYQDSARSFIGFRCVMNAIEDERE